MASNSKSDQSHETEQVSQTLVQEMGTYVTLQAISDCQKQQIEGAGASQVKRFDVMQLHLT